MILQKFIYTSFLCTLFTLLFFKLELSCVNGTSSLSISKYQYLSRIADYYCFLKFLMGLNGPSKTITRYAKEPIGSHAGRTTGVCSKAFKTSAETYCLSTTTSKTYSLNHSDDITRYPFSPRSSPQLFSTRHFVGVPLS